MFLIGTIERLLLIPVALSILNLSPFSAGFLEISRSASLYYLVVFIASLLFTIFYRKRLSRPFKLAILPLILLLSAGQIKSIWPFYFSSSDLEFNSPGIKFFMANVNIGTGDSKRLSKIIARESPQIVGLLEPNQRWLNDLNLGEKYPYRIELPQEDAYGIALYSQFPLFNMVTEFGEPYEKLPPAIIADSQIQNHKITLALVHLPPPRSEYEAILADLLGRRVGLHLRHSESPFIIGADLNATPTSSPYFRLKKATKSENAAFGFGYKRTWNAQSFFERFMIDHFLYRGDLAIGNFEVLEDFGSDHFPLVVTFSSPLT